MPTREMKPLLARKWAKDIGMKHFREELLFNTPHRRDYINITEQVAGAVAVRSPPEGPLGTVPVRPLSLELR